MFLFFSSISCFLYSILYFCPLLTCLFSYNRLRCLFFYNCFFCIFSYNRLGCIFSSSFLFASSSQFNQYFPMSFNRYVILAFLVLIYIALSYFFRSDFHAFFLSLFLFCVSRKGLCSAEFWKSLIKTQHKLKPSEERRIRAGAPLATTAGVAADDRSRAQWPTRSPFNTLCR